jgi:Na+:H+ antiporter, NhaA family
MDRRHETWVSSERFVPSRFVRPVVRFSEIEASSGIVLLAAAIIAVLWANSAFSDSYFTILDTHLSIQFSGFHFEETVLDLINDGLMVIFFFVVGLEIKRELVLGELRDPKSAALPVLAALGGMIVPALIFVAINAGGGEAVRGWGIPMATDIAFAVGVVALLGSRVPSGAKLFLLTLAIADDIGAIIVIAIFYTEDLSPVYLAMAIFGLLMVWVAQRAGIRAVTFYVALGLVIWFFTLESGVHATLAGVALGFLTPARPMYRSDEFDRRARAILDEYPIEPDSPMAQEHADHEALLLSDIAAEAVSPLNRTEHRLQIWSSFLVVPVFALANAGVDFRGLSLTEALGSSIALGVTLGLVLGKAIGISLFAYVGLKTGLGRLPDRTTWSHLFGVAAVAGIGFTVSLFIAGLAFTNPEHIELAKVGIFSGSIIAGVVGAFILSRSPKVDG